MKNSIRQIVGECMYFTVAVHGRLCMVLLANVGHPLSR